MRGFVAVVRREIVENRMVFLAALIAGLGPVAVPIVRGMHGADASAARSLGAFFGAVALAAGLSIALGFSALSKGIADRQIGFFFARPLSGGTIWAGKLSGVAAIALAGALLVVLPTLLLNGGKLSTPTEWSLFHLLALALALIPVSHAVGVALRSRTAWLALDFGALLVVVLAITWIFQRFTLAFAAVPLRNVTGVLVVLGGVGLLFAGLAAVTRGRCDSRAAHRALSTTFWGIVGVGLVAVSGYAAWVLSAAPRDLKTIDLVLPASRGSWIVVQGTARGASPAFLFDAATGRSVRAGADWRRPVLSPDGSIAVWFEPSGRNGPFEATTWKLDDPSAKPVHTGLVLPVTPIAFLSDRGERLAAVAGGLLTIYDLSSGSAVGSARVAPSGFFARGFFLDRNRFRLLRSSRFGGASSQTSIDILEFDAASRTLSATGRIESSDTILYSASRSGDRLLVREKTRLGLRDGHSGALLVTLVERGPATQTWGQFVSDGRIAASIAEGRDVRLDVFATDGQRERTIPIPAHDRIWLGGEIAPGRLVVSAGEGKRHEDRAIFLVDLTSGDVRRVGERLLPVAYLASWTSDRPNNQPERGSEASKLFFDADRALVHFDPMTGERRTLIGRR